MPPKERVLRPEGSTPGFAFAKLALFYRISTI